jgi:hypothetical protein
MFPNIFKHSWHLIAGELKERWPEFTQGDLDYIAGSEDRLVEVVARRRHISNEEARKDVDDFLRHLNMRENIA